MLAAFRRAYKERKAEAARAASARVEAQGAKAADTSPPAARVDEAPVPSPAPQKRR